MARRKCLSAPAAVASLTVSDEFPVHLDVTPETTATGGIVTDEAGLEAIYLPPFRNPQERQTRSDASVGASRFNGGRVAGLEAASVRGQRPHRRRSSPRSASRAPRQQPANPWDGQIESDLAALCPRSGRTAAGRGVRTRLACDPQVTAFVLLALGEANRDGRGFDGTGLERANSYLSAYISRTADVLYPADPNQKALMLASVAASLPETPVGPALTSSRALFEQYRSQLKNWGRAYLVLALPEAPESPMTRWFGHC